MKDKAAGSAVLAAATAVFLAVSAVSDGYLMERGAILALYRRNETAFQEAAATGRYERLREIWGLCSVTWRQEQDYTEIPLGAFGLGSATSYHGLFYSPADDLCAPSVAGPREELVPYGQGYRYVQRDGDNVYYVEPLGDHYFYYEAHF